MEIRAALYARLSLDRDGTGATVDRQLVDCRAIAERRGWTVVAEHRDDSKSAWKRGVIRPGWEALLHDIQAGGIDAVVVWHGDRLVRQPKDLEQLITLVEERGLLIASMTGQRDLANPDDRSIIRVETAMACRESDTTARRVRRVMEESAKSGKRHGAIPYGWRDEAEGQVVAEIARRLLAGVSLRTITADLNERSIPAPRGGAWTSAQVRQLALRQSNAGLRTHHGIVVTMGDWPVLVSRDDQERVIRLLGDPARRTSPQVTRVHLLSGIATCAKCGGRLRRAKVAERRRVAYKCEGLDLVIAAEPLEALILEVVQRRLQAPDASAITEPANGQHAALEARLQALHAKLDGLADDFADDVLDRRQVQVASQRLRLRIADIEAELRALEKRDTALSHRGVDVYACTVEQQRAIITGLLDLVIKPATKYGRASHELDVDRIQITWRSPS